MFSSKKNIAVFGLTLAIVSCSTRNSAFEPAIEAAKQKGLILYQAPKEGLPYFAPGTLDPIWPSHLQNTVVTIPDLKLVDENGTPQSASLFDGKITVLNFFFTSCSGFCPTLIKNIQRAQRKLRAFKSVQYLAISVNPETDDPTQLKRYSKRMHLDKSQWKLLTGEKATIWSLARETFSAETFTLPVTKGQIAHSEHCFVIDSQRHLRGVLKATRLDLPDKLKQVLSALSEKA